MRINLVVTAITILFFGCTALPAAGDSLQGKNALRDQPKEANNDENKWRSYRPAIENDSSPGGEIPGGADNTAGRVKRSKRGEERVHSRMNMSWRTELLEIDAAMYNSIVLKFIDVLKKNGFRRPNQQLKVNRDRVPAPSCYS